MFFSSSRLRGHCSSQFRALKAAPRRECNIVSRLTNVACPCAHTLNLHHRKKAFSVCMWLGSPLALRPRAAPRGGWGPSMGPGRPPLTPPGPYPPGKAPPYPPRGARKAPSHGPYGRVRVPRGRGKAPPQGPPGEGPPGPPGKAPSPRVRPPQGRPPLPQGKAPLPPSPRALTPWQGVPRVLTRTPDTPCPKRTEYVRFPFGPYLSARGPKKRCTTITGV